MQNIKKYLNKIFIFFKDNIVGNIILLILFINYGWQSFVIPSASMEKTLLVGDFLFVNKHTYGIQKPVIPFFEIPLMNVDKERYLIKFKNIKHGDILAFHPPFDNKTFYVKRAVALENDILFFFKKDLYIHFDKKPTKLNLKSCETMNIRGIKFYKNPYKYNYKSIQNDVNIEVVNSLKSRKNIDTLSPDLQVDIHRNNVLYTLSNFPRDSKLYNYMLDGRQMYKVPKGKFFMIGDNRDHSNDSRFWGPIEMKNVVGTPSIIWASINFKDFNIRFNRFFKTEFEVKNEFR